MDSNGRGNILCCLSTEARVATSLPLREIVGPGASRPEVECWASSEKRYILRLLLSGTSEYAAL